MTKFTFLIIFKLGEKCVAKLDQRGATHCMQAEGHAELNFL